LFLDFVFARPHKLSTMCTGPTVVPAWHRECESVYGAAPGCRPGAAGRAVQRRQQLDPGRQGDRPPPHAPQTGHLSQHCRPTSGSAHPPHPNASKRHFWSGDKLNAILTNTELPDSPGSKFHCPNVRIQNVPQQPHKAYPCRPRPLPTGRPAAQACSCNIHRAARRVVLQAGPVDDRHR
jgi:hypothetical protein